MNILVFDDEEACLREAVNFFQNKGWEAAGATNAQDALRLLDSSVPDAVLLDLEMPERANGLDLLGRIRRVDELRHLPVVILSAAADMDPLVKKTVDSMKAGADDCLPKDKNLIKVEQTVLAAIMNRRSQVASIRPQVSVFLCHSFQDKAMVRRLSARLKRDGCIPWLDEEQLVGGQDWDLEIRRAVRSSDAVLVCLSRAAVAKTGYLQKEIRQALDVADERPEGRIFIIPLKLGDCDVPDRLRRWHWIDLQKRGGYRELLRSLRKAAGSTS